MALRNSTNRPSIRRISRARVASIKGGFRQIYEKPIYPANQFPSGKPPRTLADKMGPVKEVFTDLYGRGQFTPPAGKTVADMADLHASRVAAAQERGTLRKS